MPKIAKGTGVDPLHQLAASVQAGETTEFPWALLRCIYFNVLSEPAAARRLARWASEYGIEVRTEQRNAGAHDFDIEWVRFNYVPRPWMPCC